MRIAARPDANRRLTALTAVALLALLMTEGVTIVFLGPLLAVHLFVGLVLIPPVALKLASTGYRFVRYYAGDGRYRAVGPPALVLRLTAPVLIVATFVVLGTGVWLLLGGPSQRDMVLPIHKISFFVWGGAFAIHLLGHLLRLPGILRERVGGARSPLAVALAVTAGVALALALLGQFPAWTRGAGRPVALPAATRLPRSARSHVVVIVLENKEYGAVIGNPDAPYLNGLARRYGLATRSYGIRHPSLPNYLALTSGSTQGIASDCTDCRVAATNVVDQLQAAGLSWKAYLQGMPSPCFTGASAGTYAKKHNPFAYYDDVAGDPGRCRRTVPLTRLARDLRSGSLPTYAWISPDLCDDTHDCGVGTGDRFLARTVPALLHELGPHGFLVLTWDEGTTDAGCCAGARGGHIATIVAGPDVRRGARDPRAVDHYGVLRTIEDALGLPRLGGAADPRNGSLAALFAHGRIPNVR